MRNIQLTRFAEGISVQPETSILAGMPGVYDSDEEVLFEDFFGFDSDPAYSDPWFVSQVGAGGGVFQDVSTPTTSVDIFSDTALNDFCVLYIPYDFVILLPPGQMFGLQVEAGTKLNFQARVSLSNITSVQGAAFGIGTLSEVSSGQMLSAPFNAVQFEVHDLGVLDFVVYRGGVEVYRDVGIYTFTQADFNFVTCTFSITTGVGITYSVGGRHVGSTSEQPANGANYTVGLLSQTLTATFFNSLKVDFVMLAQAKDRTNPVGEMP